MFVWTVRRTPNCKELLKKVMQYDIDKNDSQVIHNLLSTIDCDALLKQLFRHVLDCNLQSQSKVSKTSLIEMLAGLDYASSRSDIGICSKLLQSSQGNRAAIFPARLLRAICEKAIENEAWLRYDMWFKTRVMMMDIYTLVNMFSCPPDSICIFYGGESHARTLRKMLIKKKSRLVECPVFIKKFALKKDLISIQGFKHRKRLFVIIGEDHWRTKSQFGNELTLFLKESCNTNQKITCLIEKHISVEKDEIPTKLMCNMPDMAIHKFRCDPFVAENTCSNLNIIAVDNRHYDLGFFRMEIFLLWKENLEFRKLAIEFHKKVLQDLIRVSQMMQSNAV
tara:strand:+ start:1474 stop:2484 length:1011 start_codon:yes stop_codon:yes gene_type:complete